MTRELCEICQHSGNDYRYNYRTLICKLDNKTPNYQFYCEKVLLMSDEKSKLQEVFQKKIKKQRNFLNKLESSKVIRLENHYGYQENSECKLEFKNNKNYTLLALISLIIMVSFAIYFLIKSDFEWFGAGYGFIIFGVSIILVRIIYNLFEELLNNDVRLVIDSYGIHDKANRLIPWELMFDVIIEEEHIHEGSTGYYIRIWSLLGDYKISLDNLNFNMNKTENMIGYFKNSMKFNKLCIKEL